MIVGNDLAHDEVSDVVNSACEDLGRNPECLGDPLRIVGGKFLA